MRRKLLAMLLLVTLVVCFSVVIVTGQTSDAGINPDYKLKQCLQNCRDQYSGNATQEGEIAYSRCVQSCESQFGAGSSN